MVRTFPSNVGKSITCMLEFHDLTTLVIVGVTSRFLILIIGINNYRSIQEILDFSNKISEEFTEETFPTN
jgi:hypothetical protein